MPSAQAAVRVMYPAAGRTARAHRVTALTPAAVDPPDALGKNARNVGNVLSAGHVHVTRVIRAAVTVKNAKTGAASACYAVNATAAIIPVNLHAPA